LKRLPSLNRDGADSGTHTDFNDSIMDVLQKHCAPSKSTASRPRGKKITPGRRITPEDLGEGTSTSHTGSSAAAKKTRNRCERMEVHKDKDSDTDVENSSSSDSDDETGSAIPEGQEPEPQPKLTSLKSMQWVIAEYATKRSVFHFLGQVLEETEDGVKVTFLKRQRGSDNLFTFPSKEDVDIVEKASIVDMLPEDPVMNSRQQFCVNYSKFKLS